MGRSCLKGLVAFVLALGIYTTTNAQDVRFRLKHPEIGVLRDLKTPSFIDIPGMNKEDHSVDFIADREYFERLKEAGYNVELLETSPKRVDQGYMNPDEVAQAVFNLADQFPDIIHVEQIGKSLMGLPIIGVRLSSPENIETKPSVLFNSMHHAREVMTPEITIDMIQFLASNYDNAEMPWVRDWLDRVAVWVVPMLNPDGNWLVWNYDSWWRKNARGAEHEGDTPWGVDLNRNYPYEWGACSGSSGNKGSQTYRGSAPASEPETQALMDLVAREKFLVDISYHSYSEMVIAPYGCQGAYTPEKYIVDDLGKNIASRIKRDSGHGSYEYGIGWEIMYPVDGDDISWMYLKHNVLGYVIEVSSSSEGFQPDYKEWRDSTVQRNRPAWAYILNRVASGPQVRGQLFDSRSNHLVEGTVRIKGLPYTDETPRESKNGYYTKLLTPGSYELVFEAPGYETQEIAVSVGDEPVDLDVQLEPAQ